MKEREISREIQLFLKQVGCSVYTTEQGFRKERGGTRMTPGIPDLIVFHPLAWTFAELKTPRGRLTGAQQGFRDDCLGAGVPWQLWRSVGDAWDWAVELGIIMEATL